MNADRLLAWYERIADAPDAVGRLRRFVLDLAVRGKLMPQDPADEPASELLKRIGKEKARLVKAGAIKKAEIVEDLTASNRDFPVPRGWTLTNIHSICNSVTDGDHLPPPKAETGIPFLVIGNVRSQLIEFEGSRFVPQYYYDSLDPIRRPKSGDLLYTLVGSYGIPIIVRDDQPFCVQRHIGILRPATLIDVRFLARAMESRFAFDQATACATGIAQKTIPLSGLRKLVVPLPPLAEQHRIVAKVDELMALCDRLEAARAEREATRDRLAAASLARLNAPDPETFTDDAHFALNALPALTTRHDQIKQLRQTILNLAVRGKLVPQDPTDEPASELLRRMPPLPRPARFDSRSPELIPGDCGLSINHPGSDVPRGWLWVPLVKIARLESGHTPSRNRPDWWGGNVPWIGLVDARLHNNGTIYDTLQKTNEQGLANSAARLLPTGTVCFSRTASVGYVVIMGISMATSQDFVNWVPTDVVSSRWLQLVMIAERPAIGRFSKGAVHQTIYYPAWLSMHIALPPLAEQHRIVAKVDELMALCDQLESNLTTGDATRRRLLDALLTEALTPATTRNLEAAE